MLVEISNHSINYKLLAEPFEYRLRQTSYCIQLIGKLRNPFFEFGENLLHCRFSFTEKLNTNAGTKSQTYRTYYQIAIKKSRSIELDLSWYCL